MHIYDAAKILGLSGEVTPEVIKIAYRNASKKYHPDINPAGGEMMKLVNAAYDILKDYSGAIKEQSTDYGDNLNAALNSIFGLSGLIIELCGAWVWVTGTTQQHRAQLKESGFKWASKKKAWYFRPEEFRSRSRGKATLDDIRTKYGSTKPSYGKNYMIGG